MPFPSGLELKYSLYSLYMHLLLLLPDGTFVENWDHVFGYFLCFGFPGALIRVLGAEQVPSERPCCLEPLWVPPSHVLIWFPREPIIFLTWEVSRSGY